MTSFISIQVEHVIKYRMQYSVLQYSDSYPCMLMYAQHIAVYHFGLTHAVCIICHAILI